MKRVALALAVVILAVAIWKMRAGHDVAPVPPPVAAKPVRAGAHAATSEPASIAGTVTSEGKPVRARVCAFARHDDPRCTIAADGHFELALPPAHYIVGASAPQLRPYHGEDGIDLGPGEHETVDLVLAPGGVALTGAVADVNGGAIARARVTTDDTAIDTDDQGRFTVWVAPGMASVTAIADGYAPNDAEAHAPGSVEILLTPESSLAGTVIDAGDKQPVAGVRVTVGDELAITDDDGAFRVGRLPPGRYTAEARDAHGYGRTPSVLVGLGQHVEHVVVPLYPAVSVSGRVVYGETTCDKASLSLEDVDHKRYLTATRDPDGTLHADGVLPGTYAVGITCDGFLPRDSYPPIVVADKDVTNQRWPVDPGGSISGRVTTRTGEPIDDAIVQLKSTGGAARGRATFAQARSHDGRYELAGLADGTYRLHVSARTGVGDRDGYLVELHGHADQDLVLDDAGAIDGTVVSDTGAPVAGVELQTRALDARGLGGYGKTDQAGAFHIDTMRPGRYRVLAQRGWQDQLRKPGTTDDAKQGEIAVVRAGQTTTVRIVVESQTGTIRGSVVDASGQPVSDAFVSAVRESDAAGARTSAIAAARWSWDDRPVLTATDGKFAIEHLAPGKYTVWAYRKGGGEAFAEHVAADTEARLQIRPTAAIEGHVANAGAELDVTATDAKQALSRSESLFHSDGTFAIHDLPGGHFVVQVDAEGGHAQAEVDLADGETQHVELELAGLVTITGRIVEYGTAKPVPGVQVEARAASSWGGGEWSNANRDNISDDAGRFTVERVPRGKVLLFGTPREWSDSEYAWLSAVRVVDADTDVGDVGILKKRVKKAEAIGDFGLHWKKQPSDTQEDQLVYEVAWIDPAGPAARSGLVVGDVVTSIDGIDVTGANAGLAFTLLRVPVGARVSLGLARGVAVTITTVAP